jgi:predicted metallopeptidase
MDYQRDIEWEQKAKNIAVELGMPFDLTRIACMRSFGSTSNAIARCHTIPKIMQRALGMEGYYVIEIVSENFDHLSDKEKVKTIIHELMHIPKSMGGGFRQHDYVCTRNVESMYKRLKMRKIDRT